MPELHLHPQLTQAREAMCRVGQSLFDRGYVHATAGNISMRLDDGFLITPTDACLGYLDPAKISKLDQNGEQVSGDRASKTIRLHRAVYDADPKLRGIVHTHSTHLVALSLLQNVNSNNILAPLTPYHVMKAGRIPLIPYHRPGAPEVIDLVKHYITAVRGVMLARIGPTDLVLGMHTGGHQAGPQQSLHVPDVIEFRLPQFTGQLEESFRTGIALENVDPIHGLTGPYNRGKDFPHHPRDPHIIPLRLQCGRHLQRMHDVAEGGRLDDEEFDHGRDSSGDDASSTGHTGSDVSWHSAFKLNVKSHPCPGDQT